MHQPYILDADDSRRKKINFWFIWTIGNALGAAIGWTLGEIIGRSTSRMLGFRSGILIAGLIFELCVWLPRNAIARYFQELKALGFLDRLVWIIVEGFVWFTVDAFTIKEPAYFTLGAAFAIVLGGMMSVLFSIMGLTKASARSARNKSRKEKATLWWFIKTTTITLLGFIGISLLSSVIMTFALEIGEVIQTINTPMGWAVSGLAFGGGMGAVTGLAYLGLISRRERQI